ncbi:hypothetical protein NDU88_005745 [Pleurodeles waltl]|uniref:Uncharacterized protein n=1 Tax=Pleurodeles waltl TaxID=8319 RepID=A0AAV7VNH9_PLEWA|nr:hypothetical protein NDU88_005745 [Pleurodeles waltl]
MDYRLPRHCQRCQEILMVAVQANGSHVGPDPLFMKQEDAGPDPRFPKQEDVGLDRRSKGGGDARRREGAAESGGRAELYPCGDTPEGLNGVAGKQQE